MIPRAALVGTIVLLVLTIMLGAFIAEIAGDMRELATEGRNDVDAQPE